MKYLELKMECNHVTEVIYIRKDDILMLRSKPNEFSEDETDMKVSIQTAHDKIDVTLSKKDATALYKFFKDDKQDHLSVKGTCSTLY